MALVRFTSPAAGEIYMFEDNARTIFSIIGKDATAQGIVTAEQVPAAVAALRAAVERERAAPPRDASRKGVDADAHDEDATPVVGLGQRAYPLIDMLDRAAARGVEVLWGV